MAIPKKFSKTKSRSERKQAYEKKIFTKSWEGRTWKLIVAVSAYKGGKPKLLITRERSGKKFRETPHAKLGRISGDELKGILPILEEASHHM